VATETPSAAIMHKCRRLILLMNEYPEHLRGMSRRMSDELLQLYKNNHAWA
jgi:hypothetical protein